MLWIRNRLRIHLAVLNPDPDPYWECGSGSRSIIVSEWANFYLFFRAKGYRDIAYTNLETYFYKAYIIFVSRPNAPLRHPLLEACPREISPRPPPPPPQTSLSDFLPPLSVWTHPFLHYSLLCGSVSCLFALCGIWITRSLKDFKTRN